MFNCMALILNVVTIRVCVCVELLENIIYDYQDVINKLIPGLIIRDVGLPSVSSCQ